MDRSTRRLASAALALILVFPLLAAASIPIERSLLPPPVQMQFDPGLGVHIVRSHVGVYYFDRTYIRIHAGSWQFSMSASGPWRTRPPEWVPMGLRIKHYAEEL